MPDKHELEDVTSDKSTKESTRATDFSFVGNMEQNSQKHGSFYVPGSIKDACIPGRHQRCVHRVLHTVSNRTHTVNRKLLNEVCVCVCVC